MRNHARKPKTAAPNAPPAARTGIPVAAAAPFELELLALVVDAVVEVCLAPLTDVETEDAVAPATDWLEVVVAEAKTAMLSAKMLKNCIFVVAGVLVVMFWWSGSRIVMKRYEVVFVTFAGLVWLFISPVIHVVRLLCIWAALFCSRRIASSFFNPIDLALWTRDVVR